MPYFSDAPKTTNPLELFEYLQSVRSGETKPSQESSEGLFVKPEEDLDVKDSKSTSYFNSMFEQLMTKAKEAKESISEQDNSPDMYELAKESAMENRRIREEMGITSSEDSDGDLIAKDLIARKQAELESEESNDGFTTDTDDSTTVSDSKDEKESAPVTAETEGAGLMSRPSSSDLPAYIKEGSVFRTALAEQEAESYSTIFGNNEKTGKEFAGKDITTMSMSEVFDFVEPGGDFNKYNKDTYGKNTTAIGKYQMVGSTLRDLRDRKVLDKLGINEDTPFNKETQDKIAMHLAERRVKGKSLEAARKGMRNEWEGFKKLSNSELDAIIEEIGR